MLPQLVVSLSLVQITTTPLLITHNPMQQRSADADVWDHLISSPVAGTFDYNARMDESLSLELFVINPLY